MTELQTLQFKYNRITSRLETFSNFLKVEENHTQIEEIRERLRGISSSLKDLEDLHCKIEVIDAQKVQSSDLDKYETLFYKISSAAKTILNNTPLNNRPINASIVNDLQVKLPNIQLPCFTGLFTEWITFRDTFHSLIHNNDALTPIEKFHYLKSSLKSVALQTIEHLTPSDPNYNAAWSLLQSRYENKRIITQHHIRALFSLQNATKDAKSLRHLLHGLTQNMKALESIERPVNHWDDILIYLISQKFDNQTALAWEHTLSTNPPSIADFINFLTQRCQTLESLEISSNYSKPSHNTNNSSNANHNKQSHANNCPFNKTYKTSNYVSNVSTSKRTYHTSCIICKESHNLYHCKDFLDMAVTQRIAQVKKHNLCLNCLKSGHTTENCLSGGCKTCKGKHNTLLHNTQLEPSTSQTKNIVVTNLCKTEDISGFLSTAVVYIYDIHINVHTCRALLDSGSQRSFIKTSLCNKLGLTLKSTNISVDGMNLAVNRILHETNIKIGSCTSSFSLNIQSLVSNKITQKLPVSDFPISKIMIPDNLKLADPGFNISSEVDLLLGADVFWEVLGCTKLPTNISGLYLYDTQLGYILAGKMEPFNNLVSCNLSVQNLQNLQEQMANFWEIESFEHHGTITPEDQMCETHFTHNTKRDISGRFIVTLPFRTDPPNLGSTKEIAFKRLLSLERKFKRDPTLETKYKSFIREYEDLGHLERVPASEVKNFNIHNSCYLAHHAVSKDSCTTSLRVVFDGSCPSNNGKSLNDNLRIGPPLQQDLFAILLRFRIHQFIISGDIAKMYRQILVSPDHQNYQLILWRDKHNLPIETLRLKTVTYGLAPSPFLAIRCIHELAFINTERFPKASKLLLRDFYVDDVLTGADSVEETLQIRQDLTLILQQAGFELRKFASNDSSLLPINNEPGPLISLDMQTQSKTLGVHWDQKKDMIKYSVNVDQISNKASKRNILSVISKLFDPLGIVSPVTVTAKIILQDVWASKVDWDNPLPSELHNRWLTFLQHFINLNKLSIPRKVISNRYYTKVELHGFSDSSKKSYGACVYLRTFYDNGEIHCNLLCAKSKVAPLKIITIPRLELLGAVLLSKLVHKVKDSLSITINECFYWTDSTIVLCWIKMQTNSLKTFVAHRVATIQTLTLPNNWRYIQSSENPADILSRGTTPQQLQDNELWWFGPKNLIQNDFDQKQSEPTYPCSTEIPEVKSYCLHNIANNDSVINRGDFSPLSKFSSFIKCIRVTAYILRFINNIRHPTKRHSTPFITVPELKEAHDVIIKLVQTESFPEEINILKEHSELSKNSKLIRLHPYVDTNGLLRVGGRLNFAQLTEAQKHPLILPKSHHITNCIINMYHILNLHAGCQGTIADLRQRYWILSCRSQVRKIIFKCIKCFKTKPKSYDQLMGDLPVNRITPSRPFTCTAVDYAGPFVIKNGHLRTTKTIKSYVAVFVCFVTKAIHLELVCDCTTSTFLNALKRLMSRRGIASMFYSDNGSNFKGANRELTELFKSTNFTSQVINTLSNNEIKWQFIPARSPHRNGLAEAGVKSVKFHLKRILTNTFLNYEEFYTLLTMIEACLNSRPITPLSNDPSDLSALTPGHFLIGDALTALPQEDVMDVPTSRLSKYQMLEKLRQHFWTRWSKEYLHELQQRNKWLKARQAPPVGQVVLLREDNLPPQQWIMGRILDHHHGKDGITRTVSVKTVRGVVKRALNKVCPLPNS